MIIKRWEIWLADLDPSFGSEAGKKRPVLVIQSDLLNPSHFSTTILPITANIVSNVSILRFNLDHLSQETGLHQRSDVLIDQIRTIDNRRFIKKIGSITTVTYQQKLVAQLKIVLDL